MSRVARDEGTKQNARAAIARMAGACLRFRWTGKGGATDQRVLLALLALAHEVGKLYVDVSVRTLAGTVGLTKKTASRALHRLMEAGWLHLHTTARGTHAATYLLAVGVRHEPTTPTFDRPDVVDVFCWAGLGPGCRAVFDVLTSEPQRVTDISRRLHRHHGTVSKQLKRLGTFGLSRADGGRWVRGTATLSEVAASLGTEGRQARMLGRYRAESARWKDYLASTRRWVNIQTGEIVTCAERPPGSRVWRRYPFLSTTHGVGSSVSPSGTASKEELRLLSCSQTVTQSQRDIQLIYLDRTWLASVAPHAWVYTPPPPTSLHQ